LPSLGVYLIDERNLAILIDLASSSAFPIEIMKLMPSQAVLHEVPHPFDTSVTSACHEVAHLMRFPVSTAGAVRVASIHALGYLKTVLQSNVQRWRIGGR
jgi:hypothetical protein